MGNLVNYRLLCAIITTITLATFTDPVNALVINSDSESIILTQNQSVINVTFLELSILLILGISLLLTAFILLVRLQVKHKLIDYETRFSSNKK